MAPGMINIQIGRNVKNTFVTKGNSFKCYLDLQKNPDGKNDA